MTAETAPQAVDALQRRQAALARLAVSRRRLHAAWVPGDAADQAGASGGGTRALRLAACWRLWRRRALSVPGLLPMLRSAESAWQQSPWHLATVAGMAVADELTHVARPWLRRHPLPALLLAAATGAALVASRPWAWPGLRRRLQLAPRLAGRWLLRHGQAPLLAALAGLAGTVPKANAPSVQAGVDR